MEKRIAIIKSRQAGWTNWLEKHKKGSPINDTKGAI